MPKQYTFKTTRDTKWLEPILDRLQQSKELSLEVRNALCIYFDDERPAVSQRVRQVPQEPQEVRPVVQKVRPVERQVTPKVAQKVTPKVRRKEEPVPEIEEPVLQAVEEDLEAKLNNLFD